MRTRRLALAGLVMATLMCGAAAVAAQGPSSDVDLLPGVDLLTEEVEPGVFRVASDGVRDLSSPIEFVWFWEGEAPRMLYRNNAMATGGLAANDEGVWTRVVTARTTCPSRADRCGRRGVSMAPWVSTVGSSAGERAPAVAEVARAT